MTGLIVSLLSSVALAQTYSVVEKAQIDVPNPTFQTILPSTVNGSSPLLISSFGLTGVDHVYMISDPAAVLRRQTVKVESVTDAVVWPNEVQVVSSEIMGADGLLIASGFLFPTKNTGGLYFLDAAGKLTRLSRFKPGYFYHRASFVDVSGKGRMDILTARARIPVFGPTDAELVWLQRPNNPLEETWKEVVLAKGPDMHFRVVRNPADGEWIIIAAEFIGKKISLHWMNVNGTMNRRVIDNTLGSAFDLDLYDLNNDGRLELLATNHEAKAEKSAVFAYLLPDDLKKGNWVRKTLLSGIETRQPGINSASPGAAKAFFPDVKNRGLTKPWIIVSGDGSQRAHLLKPASEHPDNWRYRESTILDVPSTIGEPLVADFDNNGLADIAIPAYDIDKIHFFSVVQAP